MNTSEWYNFRTMKYESHRGFPPDETLSDYAPQDMASQGLYECYLRMYGSAQTALVKVLEANTRRVFEDAGYA